MSVWVGWYTVWSWPLMVPLVLLHQSRASTLKPNVVFPAAGSIRPPPVNRGPALQFSGPGVNQAVGLGFGVAGRSQPHANSAAATSPGTKRCAICLDIRCLLAGDDHDCCGRGGGKSGATCAVALSASGVERYASCCRRAALRAPDDWWAIPWRGYWNGTATPAGAVVAAGLQGCGAPRGAACGPLPAGRCIVHADTSSVTHACGDGTRRSPSQIPLR